MRRTGMRRRFCQRAAVVLAAGLVSLGLLAPRARAEVTRVEITSRTAVAGGKSFGKTGAYEELRGRAYFSLDPSNPEDRKIADLELAPRDAQGKVEFSADLLILEPKAAGRGNGVALFDIVNRGRLTTLSSFNRARFDAGGGLSLGDGFLMKHGYTIVAVGWEFDTPAKPGLILLKAPMATRNGAPITGWVSPWMICNQAGPSLHYATAYNTGVYPPVHPEDSAYRLTVRAGVAGPQRLIPRADWNFGRMEGGRRVADPDWITLKGGFEPGLVYQVTYESENPPVAGVGFASTRDMASYLKFDPQAVAHAREVYAYGESQTGRWLRNMVYGGFTLDEQGRKAVDALYVMTGGTSFGSFNQRFAQEQELGSFTQTVFPILYKTTTDPLTGRRDGLGANIPAALAPKVFFVDTGSEYWDRGRVAALMHTSLDGTRDVEDAPNVRVYSFAGTKHGAGEWPPQVSAGQQLRQNPNDYRWAHRALLLALDGWVRKGVAPPPSRHPRLADHTLIWRREIHFPDIPGVEWPYFTTGGFRADVKGWESALPMLVPAVDADGNDVGGIRTPEEAVPLGTYTDWAFRSRAAGAPYTVVEMAGGFIPFAKTKAEREADHDPRLSIAERYPSRAAYLEKVRNYADKTAAEGYLLKSDVAAMVREAGRHWDWMMKQSAASLGN